MKNLKSMVREVLSNSADFEWKLFGTKDYVQICIEPGAEIGNWIISEWCQNFDCCSSVSCVHSDYMNGYCLMIELYR